MLPCHFFFLPPPTLQSIRISQWAKGLLSNSIIRILMVYSSFLFRLKIMLLRFLLLATTVFLVKTKVKANEDSPKKKPGPPPPSFVAVVPTSIMGDFDGALFPFLIEETTTTTTTTTPAPFGTFSATFTILLKPSNSHQCCIFQKAFCSILSNESKQFFDKYSRIIENGLVCGYINFF